MGVVAVVASRRDGMPSRQRWDEMFRIPEAEF